MCVRVRRHVHILLVGCWIELKRSRIDETADPESSVTVLIVCLLIS